MKEMIRKILKEEGEGLKERFIKNMKSLEYLIQSNIKNDIIDELEFVDIEFNEKWKDISASIKVKSFSEDPDFGSFTYQLNKVEDELFRVIKNYEFLMNGKLSKVDNDSYFMMFPIKVNWESGGGDLFIEFYLHQDDYREIE